MERGLGTLQVQPKPKLFSTSFLMSTCTDVLCILTQGGSTSRRRTSRAVGVGVTLVAFSKTVVCIKMK
jgi:hypothetical protein